MAQYIDKDILIAEIYSQSNYLRELINRNAGIRIAKHFYELGLKAQKGE